MRGGLSQRDLDRVHRPHEPGLPQGPVRRFLVDPPPTHRQNDQLTARIGVDLEFAREGREFTEIADRFFSQAESAELRALPPEARRAAFYRAWTRKEAYLKAWGTGLSFASNRFTLEYIGEGPGNLLATEMPEDDVSRWHFKDVDLGPAYTGAICLEGPDCPIRWWVI